MNKQTLHNIVPCLCNEIPTKRAEKAIFQMVDQILEQNGFQYLLNCCLQKLLIKNDKLVRHNMILVNKIVSRVQIDEEVMLDLAIIELSGH